MERAAQIQSTGGPEVIAWTDVQLAEPGPGEVRMRNLAVGLGNAPTSPAVITALQARRDDASSLVREHVAWALARHHAE